MVAYVALILALIGVAVYLLSSNAKVQEIGRIVFFCGMLAVALTLAQKMVKIF